MREIAYARQAIADRRAIVDCYLEAADQRLADAFQRRLRMSIERIARSPMVAPPVTGRPGVRVLLLRRFPYKIFYKVADDTIIILHIRHTSRRPGTA